MTWTKLGDEYAEHNWKLSDPAFRLHTEALVWSTGKHLDGRLDKEEMRRWAKRPEAAPELVALGWWTDEGDHFQIMYHLGWQPTAAEWLEQSKRNRANRAKGKQRPIRKPSPFDDESSDESSRFSDDRDGTGRDGTGRATKASAPKTGKKQTEKTRHDQPQPGR